MNRTTRNIRIALAAVLALSLILSVAALAAPGKGKGKAAGKSAKASASQYQYGTTKVTICHKGKTITVGAPAVKAHQQHHGDRVGTC